MPFFPFWRFMSSSAKPATAKATVGERIPAGVLFDPTPSWAFLDAEGDIRVGIDDFLHRLTGPMKARTTVKPGGRVHRGEPLLVLQNGNKELQLPAPVSGVLTSLNRRESNPILMDENGSLVDNWLLKIKPENWESEQKKLMPGNLVPAWLKKEFTRLRDFLAFATQKYGPEYQPVMLQDGGEISPEALSDLAPEIWVEFQTEFIDAVIER